MAIINQGQGHALLEEAASEPIAKRARQQDEAIEPPAAPVKTRRSPRLKVSYSNEVANVGLEDQTPAGALHFLEAIGTKDPDFANGMMRQLTNIAAVDGKPDEDALNFVTSVVTGLAPRDQVEAMLAVQMAAIHLATVTYSCRLARVENIPQQDSAERALNKLARTFISQVEALKRYRSGGEQKVTVEHVTVNQGGQAIVGNVQAGAAKMTSDGTASPPPPGDQSDLAFTIDGGTLSAKQRLRRKR